MPLTDAQAGQTAIIATEANPVVAATFVAVGFQKGEITQGHSDSESPTKTTPRGVKDDTFTYSPVRGNEPITFRGSYLYDLATHDDQTGLYAHYRTKTQFGLMLRGVGWSEGVNEYIATGQLTSFKIIYGDGSAPVDFEAVFHPTGPTKINGALSTTDD